MVPEDIKKKAIQYFENCQSYRKNGEYARALHQIDEAISLLDEFGHVQKYYSVKVDTLRCLDKIEEAIELGRKGIGKWPEEFEGWLVLGMAYYDAKKYHDSADCFKRASKIKSDFNVLTMLANAELTFSPADALQHANEALKLEPNWKEASKIRDKAKKLMN